MEHDEVYQRITSILDGENDWVTAMATVVCELHNAFDHYHWTGFYRTTEPGWKNLEVRRQKRTGRTIGDLDSVHQVPQ